MRLCVLTKIVINERHPVEFILQTQRGDEWIKYKGMRGDGWCGKREGIGVGVMKERGGWEERTCRWSEERGIDGVK